MSRYVTIKKNIGENKMENTSVVNPVFKNIKDFLADSEKNTLMEKCYSAIRENHERKFDSSLKRLDNEKFDAHFPLVSAVVLTANKFECDALNYLVSIQNG